MAWRFLGRKPYLRREKSLAYDPAITGWEDESYLHGYWQSAKYFASIEEKVTEVCLTFVRLRWDFVKVLFHPSCDKRKEAKDNEAERGESPRLQQIMDIFPSRFTTHDWTCPMKDFQWNGPNPKCVARAVFAQPVVLGTSNVITVDSGVDLLVPNGMYTKIYLEGTYGKFWETHAMLCPHDKYENFKDCSNRGELVEMELIQKIMEGIEVCRSLMDAVVRAELGSSGGGDSGDSGSVEEARVRDLRRAAYLVVAERAMARKENWRAMYFNVRSEKREREMRMVRGVLRNITVVRRKNLVRRMPAVGFVEFANEVRRENGQRLPPMFYYMDESAASRYKISIEILRETLENARQEKIRHTI
jgi:hypothetical protein